MLLTSITDPAEARADELADTYHWRWKKTSNDQLKTHLRGPGKVLRSKPAQLAYQEIWAWLTVHHTLAALITRAAEAAEIDPGPISFTCALRIARHTATATAGIPLETGLTTFPTCWPNAAPSRYQPDASAPALGRSNEPATTATGSRSPTSWPAPATMVRRPSGSGDPNPHRWRTHPPPPTTKEPQQHPAAEPGQ